MTDPFDLQRYLDAQAGMYDRAVADLRTGGNRAQWIWLVFPQIKELGDSPLSLRFGIRSLSEARAYAAHAILGERLRECCRILLAANGGEIAEMFGEYDVMRMHSCMTLFIAAGDDNADFIAVLNTYYRGELDSRTMDFIARFP
jgi:uncharacterized protein (DUF1810 family)